MGMILGENGRANFTQTSKSVIGNTAVEAVQTWRFLGPFFRVTILADSRHGTQMIPNVCGVIYIGIACEFFNATT